MWLGGHVTCPNQVRSSLGEVGEYNEDNVLRVLVQALLQVVLQSEPIARAGSVDIMVGRGSCFSSSQIPGTRLGQGTLWNSYRVYFPSHRSTGRSLCSASSGVWNRSGLREEGAREPWCRLNSCLPSPGKIASWVLKT